MLYTQNNQNSKPPIAIKANGKNGMTRAIRFKEENTKVSLALKKATAEATLTNPSKISGFNYIKRSSNSSNRSYLSSSFTVDSVNATVTTSATNPRKDQPSNVAQE